VHSQPWFVALIPAQRAVDLNLVLFQAEQVQRQREIEEGQTIADIWGRLLSSMAIDVHERFMRRCSGRLHNADHQVDVDRQAASVGQHEHVITGRHDGLA